MSKNCVSLTKKGKEFYIFFLRFLKENKAFYAYQKAFLKNHDITYLKELCNNNDYRIILLSFAWDDTIQYTGFWKYLDKNFRNEWITYKELKNKR